MKLCSYYTFIASWTKNPRMIGAILPSSKALARAMAAQIDSDVAGNIIEIGAGTGVMTRAILPVLQRLSLPEDAKKLIVIERNDKFFHLLHDAFQQEKSVQVVHHDAQMLGALLAEDATFQHVGHVNAIISSLPLLSLPIPIRDEIIAQMAAALGGKGCIIQFSYGLKSPIPESLLAEHGLYARCAAFVLGNIPPARVWVYQR